MKVEDIKNVSIIGAGTMGQGIAQVCAFNGFHTQLYDLNTTALNVAIGKIEKNLDKGIKKGKLDASQKIACLDNIALADSLDQVKGEVIIEAALEKLEIKREIFTNLESALPKNTIFATNTSSIPITQIASSLKHPERVAGLHFFNPAHIMKLVEIIAGAGTDPKVVSTLQQFTLKLGKVPVLAQDSPGFIVNRVARHYYVEGLRVLEEGVANVEIIDELMESSGFKMGPFRLMDLIGVDTNFSVTTSMYHAFHQDAKFRPNRIQQQKVDAGHWGRKSGKGFYTYE